MNTLSIPLSQGKIAIIDEADGPLISLYQWTAFKAYPGIWYAVRTRLKSEVPGPRMILMHKMILHVEDGYTPDHINGDGLDNRRQNLRPATTSQNAMNSRRSSRNSSGYKGVSFHKKSGKWRADIVLNGHQFQLGLYLTPEQAANAYSVAARELFGEFARIEG